MKRYKCTISYDGAQFCGSQIQPNERTVQGEIERVLKIMHKGEFIRIHASGRTDSAVHAKGQVIHFDSALNIDPDNWVRALNRLLPADIFVRKVEVVNMEFHSQYDAKLKEYRYFIKLNKQGDPFSRLYYYQFPYQLDVEKMKAASKHFLGTHDFTSYSSAKTYVRNKVRTIESIEINQEGDDIIISFIGDGFLYNMIRIIVGTLIEIGTGRRSADSIPETIAAKDRRLTSKTAPACGLYLWEVSY